MGRTRGLGAFRTVFHLPRTVRLRLAVLYGGVMLVSGGALLAIAFAFGSFKSTKNRLRRRLHAGDGPHSALRNQLRVGGRGSSVGYGGSMTIIQRAGPGRAR